MAHNTNARWQGAAESHAEAKTDAISDAAAVVLDAAPERARPSLCCAEKDKESPTASLSLLSRWSPTLRPELLHLLSCGGSAGRHSCCRRLPMLQLGASASSNHCRAAPLWRSQREQGGRPLAHESRLIGKSPARFFLLYLRCSAELGLGVGPERPAGACALYEEVRMHHG